MKLSFIPLTLLVLGTVSAGTIKCDCKGGAIFCVQAGCLCNTGGADFNCNQAACCPKTPFKTEGEGDRRRRKLEKTSRVLKEGEEEEIIHACKDHDYEASLFVDSHFYAVAIPSEDAASAGCPMLVTHADFETVAANAKRELRVLDDLQEGKKLYKEKLPIGTFKLSELHGAIKEADPEAAGKHDILTNTCANYMIELAGNLGVPVDTTMISYAGRRLVEHKTERLMNYIRNTIDVSSLFEGRHLRVQEVDDDELLSRLVEQVASELI